MIFLIEHAFALVLVGQIGPVICHDPPVSTISALSLPADEDSPVMVLCIYRLLESTEEQPCPSATELAPVLRELIAPATWEGEGVYLRAINDRLIVRQTKEVQREIFALLVELGAIDRPQRGRGGPVLQSVIPVVGARPRPTVSVEEDVR